MPRQELVTASDLRVKLHELIQSLGDQDVVILRHGRPVGMMISQDRWRGLLEEIDDLRDKLSLLESERSSPDLRIPLEKVRAELGLRLEED